MLINKQLWFADPETFNDPFDCRVDYKTALHKVIQEMQTHQPIDQNLISQRLDERIKKARVCCFSKTKKNQLMWAHYAEEHKGFCIGFNIRNLLGNGNNLTTGVLPVDYKSLNPYQDIIKNVQMLLDLGGKVQSTNLLEEFIKRALATKYTGWKYEKEVRLISTKIEILNFRPESINSITFGLKMESHNKQTLKELLSSEEWSHVKWYETNKAQDRYALSFNLIKQASKIKQHSNV